MKRGWEALEAAGFRVRLLPSCSQVFDESTRPPAKLAAELHEALAAPEVDGVIAAVGGWTTLQVLPHLDIELIHRSAKPIVGYSDLTALLNYVSVAANTVTFHGPMVLSEFGEAGGPWAYSLENFRLVVMAQPWTELPLAPPNAWSDEVLWWDREDVRPRAPREPTEQPARVLRSGTAEGPLLGGSLISLGLLSGTPYWPQRDGALIFLEAEAIAPDELLARVLHLVEAGLFDTAAGVVFGKIGSPRATSSGYTDFDSVLSKALPAHLPTAVGFDIGHTEPMLTLPVGGLARLICPADGAPQLSLLRPALPRSE